MPGMTVLLVLLATYRVTLLITSDRITRSPRRRVLRWLRRRRHHVVTVETAAGSPVPCAIKCACGWSAVTTPTTGGQFAVTINGGVPTGVSLGEHLPSATAAGSFLRSAAEAHDADHADDVGPVGFALTCPWCVSVYVGAAAAAIAAAWPTGWWRWPALALAASAAAGLGAGLASPQEDDTDA